MIGSGRRLARRRQLRITFVLPGPSFGPVGGYKVVYEYASRLARRGHRVTVAHPIRRRLPSRPSARLQLRWQQARIVLDRHKQARWHPIDRSVRLIVPVDQAPARLPDADVLVATAWQTAAAVAEAPPAKGSKYYLIQHYETWSGATEADIVATWRLPLHKIVIARWLADIATELGEGGRTTHIPNGLDFDTFGVDRPPEDRDAATVGMLWHDAWYKGTDDGVAALEAVRIRVEGLRCRAFGVSPAPIELPPWIHYQRRPSPAELRRLYNDCAIFLQPSRSEGWGLPATEAMSCGCALVTTDNGGSRDYAIHGSTALVAPAGSPAAMAACVETLIRDDQLRRRIAHAGHHDIQKYTWERATERLEALFIAHVWRRAEGA